MINTEWHKSLYKIKVTNESNHIGGPTANVQHSSSLTAQCIRVLYTSWSPERTMRTCNNKHVYTQLQILLTGLESYALFPSIINVT